MVVSASYNIPSWRGPAGLAVSNIPSNCCFAISCPPGSTQKNVEGTVPGLVRCPVFSLFVAVSVSVYLVSFCLNLAICLVCMFFLHVTWLFPLDVAHMWADLFRHWKNNQIYHWKTFWTLQNLVPLIIVTSSTAVPCGRISLFKAHIRWTQHDQRRNMHLLLETQRLECDTRMSWLIWLS